MAKITNKRKKEIVLVNRPARILFKKLIYFLVSVNLLNIAFIFIFQKNIPPEVPLFYGLAEGTDQLTNTFGLLIPSLFSLGVIGLNVILSLVTENKFLRQTLIVATL